QKLTALAFAGVFFAVGGQASWILRPYLVRPRTEHIPFVRGLEGGFLDSLGRSTRSAAGVYDDDGRIPADRPVDAPKLLDGDSQ
ncbi:MAG: hypothetical protein ACOYLX_09005, partial [Burkholderiaceae bacterium]